MRDYAMVLHLLERDLDSYISKHPFNSLNAGIEAAYRQRSELFKKLAPAGQSPQAIDATVKKFVEVNDSVCFDLVKSDDDESITYMLSLAREEVWKLLDMDSNGDGCDFGYLSLHLSTGPGASRLADSTNWYSKMWDSDHSYTHPHVLALYRAAVVESETWTSAHLQWQELFRPRLVSGNSLFTVPKNAEISRTCCTEPLLNMLFQQAVGSFLECKLLDWSIDLSRQPDLNRALCREGSLHDSYGTIDLSSASDSIATSLCEWILPPCIFKWLRLFRSETTRLPDGRELSLNMISTMGNGFTFPLETIIFGSAVRAVYRAKGIDLYATGTHQNWAVFGDDIVVRKDCYAATVRLLCRMGFKVNEGKSFNDGLFRESCGFDYWQGINIRPVHIETLETPQAVYSAFNRLARWSAEHRIPIGSVLSYLSSQARFLPIPFSESDDAGFKVPLTRSPLRFNGDGWYKFRKLVPKSTAMKVPEASTARKAGYADFNPYGWELAFLGSFARNRDRPLLNPEDPPDKRASELDNGVIHRRPFQGEVLPRRLQNSVIPFWDWFGSQDEGRFSRSSLETWQGLLELIFPLGR